MLLRKKTFIILCNLIKTRIPKLGSYFIVNFEIKNYLTLDIFNDSTEKRIEYY